LKGGDKVAALKNDYLASSQWIRIWPSAKAVVCHGHYSADMKFFKRDDDLEMR